MYQAGRQRTDSHHPLGNQTIRTIQCQANKIFLLFVANIGQQLNRFLWTINNWLVAVQQVPPRQFQTRQNHRDFRFTQTNHATKIIIRNITALLTQNFQHLARNLADIGPSITAANNRHQQLQVAQPRRTVTCQLLAGTINFRLVEHFHSFIISGFNHSSAANLRAIISRSPIYRLHHAKIISYSESL